mmetsp:Transcript_27724/g.50228  ORF Transcript_27724/g.50228 Transcript_27724/m.50228 type:complete len:118 (+) Transcript_27724:165-518(+)
MPPPLPPGWVSANDPVSGRVYFANPTTRETSWEPPIMIPPPPPPPVALFPAPPSKPSFNEIHVSAGKIADMCSMQPNREPYRPLESHLLSALPPHIEEARLETRMATLYDQLNRLSS